jgi:3-polyprenyl-4-hydroxybenzoate decarboxylase
MKTSWRVEVNTNYTEVADFTVEKYGKKHIEIISDSAILVSLASESTATEPMAVKPASLVALSRDDYPCYGKIFAKVPTGTDFITINIW